MEILIKIGQFILSISILVILHELGHFIPAKIFKTRVEKFYLFFNPWFSLFKKKIKDTEYGIGWLPLGGYVKISGMIDESMDKEQMKKEPQPYEFRSKKPWQRFLIMFGGVFVNIITAIFIYAMITYTWGETYLPNKNVTYGISVMSKLGYDLGLKDGDKIISIDGKEEENFFSNMERIITGNTINIERGDSIINLKIPKNFIEQLIDSDNKLLFYPRFPFIIAGIQDSSINKNSGLQINDQIIRIQDNDINYFDEAKYLLEKNYSGEDISIYVKRGNDTAKINVTIDSNGKIGIYPAILSIMDMDKLGLYKTSSKDYGFFESFPKGISMSYERLKSQVQQFKKILNPSTGAYKGLGGFLSIGNMFPSEWNWKIFWNFTAFLSIMLAFFNILPIPALDGGHIMFLIYEIITKKKPSEKFLEYAQIVGFIILLSLFALAQGNDIIRLFK